MWLLKVSDQLIVYRGMVRKSIYSVTITWSEHISRDGLHIHGGCTARSQIALTTGLRHFLLDTYRWAYMYVRVSLCIYPWTKSVPLKNLKYLYNTIFTNVRKIKRFSYLVTTKKTVPLLSLFLQLTFVDYEKQNNIL